MSLSQKDNSQGQHQVVIGAFRAQGKTFASWCDDNGVARENARAALHGLWRGLKADAAIEKILDGADRDVVCFLISPIFIPNLKENWIRSRTAPTRLIGRNLFNTIRN